jgi:aminodeoxyfutalosine deaminase
LMGAGLYVTINSDDPPMFNTTLTNEYLVCQQAFDWDMATIKGLMLNAVDVTLLPEDARLEMRSAFETEFKNLIDL